MLYPRLKDKAETRKVAVFVFVTINTYHFFVFVNLVLSFSHMHRLVGLLRLDERRLVRQLSLALLDFIAEAVHELKIHYATVEKFTGVLADDGELRGLDSPNLAKWIEHDLLAMEEAVIFLLEHG